MKKLLALVTLAAALVGCEDHPAGSPPAVLSTITYEDCTIKKLDFVGEPYVFLARCGETVTTNYQHSCGKGCTRTEVTIKAPEDTPYRIEQRKRIAAIKKLTPEELTLLGCSNYA